MRRLLPVLALLAPAAYAGAGRRTVPVRNAVELRAALAAARPGDTLRLSSGEYPGGFSLAGVANVTLEGADAENPPNFRGGNVAFQFSRCPGLTLRNLRVSGQRNNGLNVDDGGDRRQPVRGVLVERVRIEDIGPVGNFDGFKGSGLEELTLRDCTLSGWGGQGIDLVGCSRVRIANCTLTGKPGYSASAGVQVKGGCSDVLIEGCRFENAGERPLNLGGSTGLDYFRPPDAKYEARRVTARNNTIEGGLCAAAFVGVDGAEFSGNRIRRPGKWIFRVLQETRAPGFTPCRDVRITGNDIVFRRAQVQVEVNVGDGTAPETCRFARNRWYAEDRPEASRPRLPTPESEGVYGMAPG